MIGLWIAAAMAADPAALRQVQAGGGAADLSTEAVGVAADVGPVLLAVDHAYGSYVAAHVGVRRALVGADRPWGLDAVASGGLAGLLATPGVALLGMGEIRGGVRDDRGQATLGVVLPVAVRVDLPPQLALPLGLELRLAARLGPLWLGCRGQVGGTLTVRGAPAGRATAAAFVGVGPQ
ncbi:MAG: hypothetical protein ACI8PZ_007164 [Myxococcota bacterium]|jgi:hypothetical protein